MKLAFKPIKPDAAIQSITTLLESIVLVKAEQYEIDTDVHLNHSFFADSRKFRFFFEEFARFANPLWGKEWNFSKFPFRQTAKELTCLYPVLKRNGVYQTHESITDVNEIEGEFKHRFRGTSSEIVILCAVNYAEHDEKTKSVSVSPTELAELARVSSWFFGISWDNLIFIVNPEKLALYVIAFTEEQ